MIKKNEIVERRKPQQYKLFHTLSGEYKTIFNYAALHCERVVTVENLEQLKDQIKSAPDFIKDYILKSVKSYNFVYLKIKLSDLAPSQKILFILEPKI